MHEPITQTEACARANPWPAILRRALRRAGHPVLVCADTVTPGESLWAGTQAWIGHLRHLGLRPGDRVVHALPPGPGAFMAMAAALHEGLTLAMCPPGIGADELLERFDARAAFGMTPGDATLCAEIAGSPIDAPVTLRDAIGPPTPAARFILSTSGTGGRPKLAVISDHNVLSVLRAHERALRPAAGWTGVRAMSGVPWHHAFGLIIDLLPALLGGATVLRDPFDGREPGETIAEARRWGVNWMSMVPLQASRLAATTGGRAWLRSLRGGIVGGAPVSGELSAILSETRIRAGYGQTEASPGITLGEPGDWRPGWLGRPLGCRTRLTNDGVLEVAGPNVCSGFWQDARFVPADPDRWLRTGDRVTEVEGGFVFLGREDEAFKLANGRLVDAPALEHALRVAGIASEVVVAPVRGGQSLAVGMVFTTPPAPTDSDRVRRLLGPLAPRFSGLVGLPPDRAPRSAKGALDRRAWTDLLNRVADTGPRDEKETSDDHAFGATVLLSGDQRPIEHGTARTRSAA